LSEFNGNFFDHLNDFVGETVTIFTTSGGQSGFGFTGVVLKVNPCFVRLITRIGPAPGCALGNDCTDLSPAYDRYDNGYGGYNRNRCHRDRPIRDVGSVVDIPLDRIAAFVHNAV
jgi:hypothetical protein